jgi:hypothetical protein
MTVPKNNSENYSISKYQSKFRFTKNNNKKGRNIKIIQLTTMKTLNATDAS